MAEVNRSVRKRSRAGRAVRGPLPVLALLLTATVAFAGPGFAQSPSQTAPPGDAKTPRPTADEVKKALDARRDELKSTLDKAGAIEQDVAKLAEERGKINQRLQETALQIQESESRLTVIENRLGELEIQEKMIRGSLAQRQGQISTLLAALQRMGRNPPPVIVTKRKDALEMVRSAMLLASAFPGMRTQALELADQLSQLMRVVDESRAKAETEKAENARLNDLKTQLAGFMEEKRRSILERQDELRQVRDAANDISKSVSDLNDLITQLGKTVQDNTGLGAYDAEVRTAEAAPAPAPAVLTTPTDPNGTSTSPAGEATDVVVMAPVETAAVMSNPGRIKPAIPFQQARGKLPLPVSGKRVLSYGERTQYGSQSKGLVMETRSAAQVTSPCDGWVLYAGEFRSYGKLLIIDAGGGYNVVLAGLSQIDVQPGEFILAAEPVGTMMTVKKEPAGAAFGAPVLYIEFRKEKQPIDPDPWWVAVPQKAQG
ncbi:MAG: peptidoglycan DD-metalloendopeptidase family protein [Hyphomicrobium sp.]|nr:peptidoglycan DD-metalloendopeptidase family protein [Hyphomicrobium sp.]